MKFTDFNLHDDLQKGIEGAGYSVCTPVQEQVLKTALEGDDLYVQSQTGTGKTAAFLIAIIQEMLTREDIMGRSALVLVPTRELAVQVEQEAKKLCAKTNLTSASFYGGVGYGRQTEILKKNVNIIIGTPGRIIDLQESGAMDLSSVAFLIVDEADRMFDMGFYPDLRSLIKVLPSSDNRQTMLFSATLNTYIKNLAWEYTLDAQEIIIEAEQVAVEEIDQMLVHVASSDKMKLLLGILKQEKPQSVIIFCNTKKMCEIVSKRLSLNGFESEYIIGDLPQVKRLHVLNSFKAGSLLCLVATDVAARGIDVQDLAMVINYDLPVESENYVHRIGRTARAGKSGKAYTFCSEQDVYNLPAIERYLGSAIPSTMAGDDMFAVDASEGVYIKTGYYTEDSHRDERRRSSRSNDKRSDYKNRDNRNYQKRDKTYTKKSSWSDTGYKKSSYKYNSEKKDAVDLSQLSFEERMKLYKEKYADSGSSYGQTKKRYQGKNNSTRPYKKNTKYDASSKKQRTEVKNVQQKEQKKTFASWLKKVFGKKDS